MNETIKAHDPVKLTCPGCGKVVTAKFVGSEQGTTRGQAAEVIRRFHVARSQCGVKMEVWTSMVSKANP